MTNYPIQRRPNTAMAIASFSSGLFAMLWYPLAFAILFLTSNQKAVSVVGLMIMAAPIVMVVLGIIGLVFAGVAKKSGCYNGFRTAGFILSLLDLIFGAMILFIFLLVLIFAGMVYRDILNWLLTLLS